MDLLAAASAYVYRDEAIPSTGGFLADLRHVEDNYLLLWVSMFVLVCIFKKVFPLHFCAPFFVECTRAEILRRAKIARAKFALKTMSWNLPFTLLF